MARKKTEVAPFEFDKPTDNSTLSIVDNEAVAETKKTEIRMDDPSWTDFVYGLFEDIELFEGRPTVDGLARVAQLLFGPILLSQSHIAQCPNKPIGNHAVVEHTIQIVIPAAYSPNGDDYVKTVTKVSDCNEQNTKPEMWAYTVSYAGTRAKGNALKEILGLSRVYSREEIEGNPEMEKENVTPTKITKEQKTVMDAMCNRLRINQSKFLTLANIDSIDKLSGERAMNAIRLLHKMQRGIEPIPDNIREQS